MRPSKAVAALALAGLLALGLLAGQRRPWQRLTGDEPTYLAMAESLARDGDLRFEEADRRRALAGPRGADTVILQRTDRGLFYSKPILYPLLLAPWVRWTAPWGPFAANGLFLLLGLLAAGAALRRRLGRRDADLTLVTFVAAGALLPYLGWRTADTLQVALTLGGLALALGGGERQPRAASAWLDRAAAPWWGGACLAALTLLRPPNGLVALAAIAAPAAVRDRRRALRVAGGVVAAGLLLTALQGWLGGSVSPYRAVRATFDRTTGYPLGDSAPDSARQFVDWQATYGLGLKQQMSARLSFYAALYFFVGRHTGVLVYFPAALALAVAALRRPDRRTALLLAAVGGLVVFYLATIPRNYFGGAAFVGNRYFLVAYAALLPALARPPSRRALAAVWLLAAVVWLSAWTSLRRVEGLDASSQSHAHAGIFTALPLESVAAALDGTRDRFWSSEFVRFADPWPRVEDWGFKLSSRAPAAELMVANGRDYGALRFVVQAEAPQVELVYEDWRRREVRRLETGWDGRARGLVEIVPGASWRRHPFRWRPDESWWARVFRLAVRRPDGEPVVAELRYVGPYRPLPKFFAAQALAAALPERAPAGGETALELRLRNRGQRYWASEDAVPIHLRYRLERAGGGRPEYGRLAALPGRVEPGAEAAVELPVRWPARPGRYRLTVDLLAAGTLSFEEMGGAPLAVGEVEVAAPAAAGDR